MKKILNKIKDFTVPHEGNDFKPHFFRGYLLGIVSIVAIFLLGLSMSSSLYVQNKNLTAAVVSAILVENTNNTRLALGGDFLSVSPVLEYAANLKAEDMANNNYFAHTSPGGITPWHWFSKAGYDFVYAGENLAVDFTESNDVSRAWMNSPKHKKNIVDSRFTEIGIAVKDGFLNGKPTTFVVQMFGRPAFTQEKFAENNTQLEQAEKNQTLAVNAAVKEEGEVKGEIIETIESNIEVVEQIENTIIAQNINNNVSLDSEKIESINSIKENQKIIYKSSFYIDFIYKIMLYISGLAMAVFVFVEFKKQHPKNIILGLIVIFLILFLAYINKTYLALPGIF